MVHQEHVKHLEHLVNGESEKHNTQLRQKKTYDTICRFETYRTFGSSIEYI